MDDLSSPEKLDRLTSARTIFVKADLYEDFFGFARNNISARILMVGNSDRDFTTPNIELPDSVDIAYFQNLMITATERFRVLPIGVENLALARNTIPLYFAKRPSFADKKMQLLVGPFSPTHCDRISLSNFKSDISQNWTVLSDMVSPFKYSKFARQCKFVAAPRGNGEDTHRFWESLYLNSIPIVKQSAWVQNVKQIGIPCISVRDWNIEEISQAIELFTSDPDLSRIVEVVETRSWTKQFSEENLYNGISVF
jgi:hypothetical protein